MDLEICVNSIQSAFNAKEGGARRIELCQNLNQGGTSPSLAVVEYCLQTLKLRTHVLLRPRSGDFNLNELEYQILKREVGMCKDLGVQCIVVGFLDENRCIDVKRTQEIVKLAGNMEVTFHRAFDICKDWETALEQIVDCGCHRILTSGQMPTAPQGIENLKKMVERSSGRIKIMAGSGVNPANARNLILSTGVDEVHASCKTNISTLGDSNPEEWLEESNYSHTQTDPTQVAQMVQVLREFGY